MRYLITPTLYNAYRYYISCDPERAEQKYKEFLGTLTKQGFTPTPAILKGFKFEDDIRAYCDGKLTNPNEAIKEIGEMVKGGIWQTKVSVEIEVNGLKILLYGKPDVIKADVIDDIKRSGYYEIGKYRESLQHLIYMYCSQIPKFRYLIGYGTGDVPSGVAVEDYYLTEDTLQQIKTKCAELLNWLEVTGLMDTYKKYWVSTH